MKLVVRITKKNITIIIMAFILLVIMLGSFLFISSPSFAVGTIIVSLIGPIYFFKFIKLKHKMGGGGLLFLFGTLFLLSIFAVLFFPTYSNVQYLKAFGFIFFLTPILIINLANRPRAVDLSIIFFTIIICFYAFMQLTYIYWGVGIDPTMVDAKQYIADDLVRYGGVRSIFTNSNDFSCICLLLVIYYLFKLSVSAILKNTLIAILSLMIIFAASRICFVSLIVVFMTYGISLRGKIDIRSMSMLVSIFLCLYFYSVYLYEYFGDTYWSIKISSIMDSSLGSDGSSVLRLSSYRYFIENMGSIGLGSFVAQDYSYFFTDALMRQNPHSLMVELGLLYGYLGVFIFIFIILWGYLSMRRIFGRLVSVLLITVFIALTFTSSSVINFPAFWVLFLLCFGNPHAIRQNGIKQQLKAIN